MTLNPGQRYSLEKYANYFANKNIPTNYYKDNQGRWYPLYPDKLGRRLDHIEMDYNLALVNKGIAHFRVYSSDDGQLEGKDLSQADKDKFIQFKYDPGIGEYFFQLTSVDVSGSGTGGTAGTSGTSGTSGEDGTPGTSGTSGETIGSQTNVITQPIDNSQNNTLFVDEQSDISLEELNGNELNLIMLNNSTDACLAISFYLLNDLESDFKAQINNLGPQPINLSFLLPSEIAGRTEAFFRLIGLVHNTSSNWVKEIFQIKKTLQQDTVNSLNIVTDFNHNVKLHKASKLHISVDKETGLFLLESEWKKGVTQSGIFDSSDWSNRLFNDTSLN